MLIGLQTLEPKVVAPRPKVEDYIFLAEVIAHRFRQKNKRAENIKDTEAYSIACEELVKAAHSYDPDVNPDFSRYAFRLMRNGVIDSIRTKNTQKRSANFEAISDKEWDEVPAKGERSEGLPVELLRMLLSDHPEDTDQDRGDKSLLMELYLREKNITVIAEQYGISRVTVYSRLRRIFGKIRQRHADLIEIYGGILDERNEREPCCLHGRGQG